MASAPRSDRTAAKSTDPLRPADHIDQPVPEPGSGVAQPKLGLVGYLRFFWRQLTSMRTALVLLLLLALAAVPGSLVPQRSSDPNGVLQYKAENPDSFKILDALGVFSTFSSPWFSAIYLLLFVSLVGCILPRTKHHLEAMRARPPKTPVRLSRLVGHTEVRSGADVEAAVDEARAALRSAGYRVEPYPVPGGDSISAERGYLRETGNLVFHAALVGVLVTVGVGGGFGYNGQKVIVQDTAFTNSLAGYDSFNPGRFFTEQALEPFSVRLDDFDGHYELNPATGVYQPVDYTAHLSVRTPGTDWTDADLKVNEPFEIGGTKAYLLGNGYAPVVTVRDTSGAVAYTGPVAFLPLDGNLMSRGVIKVPDGLDEQLGFMGFFYPDPLELTDGTFTSLSPYAGDASLLSLNVYTGDLGLDAGVSVNAYTLDVDELEQIAGPQADTESIKLVQGQTAELPNGLGTIEFTGLKRFASVEFHHDPTEGWVLVFALLILGGLLLSLFVPRRRMWVKAVADGDGTRIEYAGLARGEDPTLAAAVADLARRHQERLERRMNP
ncbi:cytochrome c biogenesis protein ResB [Homoserinibacter sp. GY 40078]|uniref:cytochrome c biogenesis protein ResB n=1 Tax=Homoserinibacter sp. GY 40078 TaxID=2603275 RepID=UPI0011C75242|nr:cytochrome c biogenesis protein ResB [Homoserinibacter sp. GY 40078]TXK18594.1 cytochrome c biogenesis protein ResB [Homoserinibacter sp. GY 40078]